MKTIYKFSIIVPIFNPGIEFKKCLSSIEKSTNFFSIRKKIIYEILIINDGGKKINLNLKKNYKNLKLLRLKKNKGVGFARNFGAKKAKYNNLFFIDSDLVIEKNFFLTLFKDSENLKNVGSIGAIQNYVNLNQGIMTDFVCAKSCYGYEKVKNFLEFSVIRSECCLIRKSLLKSVGGWRPFSGAGGEEFDLGHRIIENGKKNYLTKNTSYSHKWDDIFTRSKNIILRTSKYLPIFLSRKKFETKGAFATFDQALSALFTLLTSISLFLFIYQEKSYLFFSIFFVINLLIELQFLKFAMKYFAKKRILLYLLGIFIFNFCIIFGSILGIFNLIKFKLLN
tara:strand:- start:84 stop:1100 length:1017 start_codon:yes stop_codon:yes gene_type:complete